MDFFILTWFIIINVILVATSVGVDISFVLGQLAFISLFKITCVPGKLVIIFSSYNSRKPKAITFLIWQEKGALIFITREIFQQNNPLMRKCQSFDSREDARDNK